VLPGIPGRSLVVIAAVVCLRVGAMAVSSRTLDRATGTTIDANPLLTNAWRLNWNPPSNVLSYMQPAANGYYRIFTARSDGQRP
jgi:hypothetical protein